LLCRQHLVSRAVLDSYQSYRLLPLIIYGRKAGPLKVAPNPCPSIPATEVLIQL
jgi:hypothetical protein